MNEKKLSALFQQLASQQDEQARIDLWPVVSHSLASKQGEQPMKHKPIWRPVQSWATVGVTLALLIAFFTVTPLGRTWAQSIIHFFIPEETNTLQAVTEPPAPLTEVQPVAPAAPAAVAMDCNEIDFPSCTMDEIKGRVPFAIAYPAALPEGYSFGGAKTIENGVLLTLNSSRGSYYLYEEPLKADVVKTSPVGKAAEIIAASVNGSQAEYVEGSWSGTTQSNQGIPWNENDYYRTLAWSDGALEYRLVSIGAKVADSARPSLEKMIELAESISPASPLPVAAEKGLSLAEAEQQAGFKLMEPSYIPPGMIADKAVYNPANSVICHYYRNAMGTTANALIIAQSTAGLWSPYDFKVGMVDNGSGGMVEITMFVEHVDMPEALNDKAIYMSNGIRPSKLCGGEEESANHALIWHHGGRSSYIFGPIDNMGYPFVTKMELEKMAFEMAGLPAREEKIDPERILSKMDAELLWGEKVAFPAKMLGDQPLNHFSFRDFNDGQKMLSAQFVKTPVDEFTSLYQIANSTQNMDSWTNDAYQAVTVWGLPARYNERCSEDALFGKSCNYSLIWMDGTTEFSLMTRTKSSITQAQFLEIAESMKN